MEKDQEQKKEGDSEGRAEEPETEPISDEFERRMRDLGEKMKIRFAKNRGHQGSSEHAKAESRTMKQDQIDLALEAWRQGASLQGIKEMIAIPGKTVDSFELWDVLLEKGALTKESLNTRDETLRQTQSESKHPNFEEYDAVRWQTAAEETTVDETRNEAEASASDNTKDVGERVIESPKPALTLEPEFVRARKDSKVGRKPYYKKGDVLRVINKTSRRDPNDGYFELLPLKPPGEAAEALIRDFKPAKQAAVDAVGREAKTDKEIHSYRYAIEWED